MKNFMSVLLSAMIFLIGSIVHAEVKTYTGKGEYYMSDYETPHVAQERAKQRAEQDACEQAGVYVKSFSRMKNFQVVEDEVIAMTNGILKIIDVQYHREHADNNTTLIRATIKAQIDDADVLKWLNKDSQEKSTLVSQMEAMRKANEEQARQIAELKKQLANVKTQQDAEQITKKFADEDKIFLSNQKVDEAWKLYDKGDYNGAISIHNEALEINPNNSLAYYGRGTAYEYLKQHEQAIQDFNKAIELNPKNDAAYNNRGFAYNDLGQYDRAIQDYNKTIELNPNNALAYNNRGNAYLGLKQYERAIQDYNKAIKLNPNMYKAYNNRGTAYLNLGQNESAIQDFDKAIDINPNWDWAYNNRGLAYRKLGQYEKAISDATKAIQLNPNLWQPYMIRGTCYQKLGDKKKAQADFAKAKELGYNG